MAISDKERQQICAAANYRCEYCKTSSKLTGMPLVMDHILPQVAGGSDEPENLAAACYRCNEFKGAKTYSTDPATSSLVNLFNPRTQSWTEHFVWANGGTHIVGLTPTGRATVITLKLNNDYVVGARILWIESNWHPPTD